MNGASEMKGEELQVKWAKIRTLYPSEYTSNALVVLLDDRDTNRQASFNCIVIVSV